MASRVLQQLLDAHYSDFAETHPLSAHVRDAVHALRSCRTAALGGHVQACPDGHMERVWYNSCRHRCCPQCAQLQIAQWLERQQARLLAATTITSSSPSRGSSMPCGWPTCGSWPPASFTRRGRR